MKLPRFDYATPATLDEAVEILAAGHGTARVIAGGQSLIPVLALRLAEPSLLVDLRRIAGLDAISISDEGVTLGASARWCDIEADPRLRQAHQLLAAAVDHVAHVQIRNRGTVGGSMAHADPAAELPAIAVTCDATVRIAGANGERIVAATDFFVGPLMTVLEPDEIVVELAFPRWPAGRRWAFCEFARQRGGFALAGIALHYDERDGRIADAHVGVLGASSRLHRITEAEAVLNGVALDEAVIERAADAAMAAVDPIDEVETSADYRRALVGTLLKRALRSASTREESP